MQEEKKGMGHFYFVRHGQTVWNVENKICGAADSPLTEKGHEQAKETGRMLKERMTYAYEEDEDLLEDVLVESKQAKEMVEMYAKILARLADTFSSIISNNQNLVMKFLAAMTIILAIPTVISSFFGMNVPVPLADNPYGFFYVTLMAGSIAGASAYVLYHRDMF